MRLLYCGELWDGSTSLQRAQAFARQRGVQVTYLDTTSGQRHRRLSIYERARWKAGWPVDSLNENARLNEDVAKRRPDVAFVDNSKVVALSTISKLREQGVAPIYYSPDDIVASHNFKRPFRSTLSNWEIVFTTKSFNVAELGSRGVRKTILIGNAFDCQIHRPLHFIERDSDYEAFDVVFIGAFEAQRCDQINALAKAGLRVVVYGAYSGMIATAWRRRLRCEVTLRPGVFGDDYRKCLHHGKVALGSLRQINRDVITTRSIEIPAMARPMVAEKTEAHDDHFVDGMEYVGFQTTRDLVAAVKALLRDADRRRAIGQAGRLRCLSSGYSTDHRAREMLVAMKQHLAS